MAIPSNLPGGGGGGAARLVPALPMVLILQLHLHTVRAEGGTIWGEDQKRGPSKYIYSQPWNPTGEYLLRHFLHRFANFIDVAAHAPQDLPAGRLQFCFADGKTWWGQAAHWVWRCVKALPCVPELTPDSTWAIFCWNDKPTFKGSCKFILSCRMTCNPIQCIELAWLHDHSHGCLPWVLYSTWIVLQCWFFMVFECEIRNVSKCDSDKKDRHLHILIIYNYNYYVHALCCFLRLSHFSVQYHTVSYHIMFQKSTQTALSIYIYVADTYTIWTVDAHGVTEKKTSKCLPRLREESDFFRIFAAGLDNSWMGQQTEIFDFSEFQMLFLKIVCRFAKDGSFM